MKTKIDYIKKSSTLLKNELNSVKSPDLSSRIASQLDANPTNSASIFVLKPYMVAAALVLLSLNVSAVWYSWTYQQEETQTELADTLSVYESTWNSYLTLAE